MDTYLTVTGNLTHEPAARTTASGQTVVTLRVASNSRRFDKDAGEFRDGDPLYISVTCWRTLGTNVVSSLRKGDSVVVNGRLIYRSYDDKEGNRRSTYEIDAVSVGPDLSRCPADLRRPARPGVEPPATPGSAPGQPAGPPVGVPEQTAAA